MMRAWVNQPSLEQKHHKLHGTNVLAESCPHDPGMMIVWFLSGDVIKMRMEFGALSLGWLPMPIDAS